MNLRSTAAIGSGVLLALLTGCTTIHGALPASTKPDPAEAYVAGRFGHLGGSNFGLVLADATEHQTLVTFGEFKIGRTMNDLVGIVALPPGEYRAKQWFATGHELIKRDISPDEPLGRPFTMTAGHVLFVGSFDASVKKHFGGATYTFTPHAVDASAVRPLLGRTYPPFEDAPMECLLCDFDASASAADVRPFEPATPGFGARTLTVHYHRPDGRYAGWELSADESFERPEAVRDPAGKTTRSSRTVDWHRLPDGVDEYGAYWKLNPLAFANGRVNFWLALRDWRTSLDNFQEGFWILADSSDAWVVARDPRVHLSRKAAETAPPYVPPESPQ